MYVCGPTVYDDAPPRPRALHARLGHPAPLPGVVGPRRPLRVATSPTSRTRSSPGPRPRSRDRRRGRRAVRGGVVGRPWTTSGCAARRRRPHATAYVEHMVELIDGARWRNGHAYLGGDGVYFAAETRRRLRAAGPPADRVAARPAPGSRWTRTGQAGPDRLRPLEGGQAGRAGVAVAVGRRAAGLAHRVRRHVARPARRGLRPARRRASTWPSPTTRTSGPRPSAAGRRVRPPLGPLGHGRGRGRGKDVASRSATRSPSPTCSTRYDPRAYRLLVLQSHYRSPMTVTPTRPWPRPRQASSASTPSPASSPAPAASARRPGALDRVPGPHGRRPRHSRARCASVRAGTRARPRRGSGRGGRPAGRRRVRDLRRRARVCPSGTPSTEVPPEQCSPGPPARRGPGREGLGRADRIRDELQAQGWIVEDGPDGTTIRR